MFAPSVNRAPWSPTAADGTGKYLPSVADGTSYAEERRLDETGFYWPVLGRSQLNDVLRFSMLRVSRIGGEDEATN